MATESLLVIDPSQSLKKKLESLDPKLKASNEPVSWTELKQLHQERKQGKAKKAEPLYKLLRGSKLGVRDTEERKEASEDLQARRMLLSRKQDERTYQGMVKGIARGKADEVYQEEMKSSKQHLSIGLNMFVARVTAFVACYMVANSVTHDHTNRVLAGLFGSVVIMIIEMVLHITRATKLDEIARIARDREENEEKQRSLKAAKSTKTKTATS